MIEHDQNRRQVSVSITNIKVNIQNLIYGDPDELHLSVLCNTQQQTREISFIRSLQNKCCTRQTPLLDITPDNGLPKFNAPSLKQFRIKEPAPRLSLSC